MNTKVRLGDTDLGLTLTHSCEKANKQALFLTIVAAAY